MGDCLHTAKQVLDELGHVCPLCRIAALEADCRDMAEDVLTYAKEQYGDGDGGIHPALHHRWRRDTETARKYRPEALGEVDREN